MGKLTAIKPRLNPLPSRLRRRTDVEGHDPAAEPWRDWYHSKRWKALRVRVFQRDGYACQWPDCGAVTERPIADHVIRHQGDPTLFWDEGNVQTLCKACHDGPKQMFERRHRVGG